MSHWSGFENVFHLHSWIHHHLRIKILSFDLLSALDVHSIEESKNSIPDPVCRLMIERDCVNVTLTIVYLSSWSILSSDWT